MVIVVNSRRRTLSAWTAMAVGLACLACAPADVVEIEGRRIVSAASRPVRTGLSTAQRFGAPAPEAQGSPLSWTLPPGWQELQASGMRLANLRPAGHPDAECTLVILGGDGGGLEANVNRWRREQMGLEPLAPGAAVGIWATRAVPPAKARRAAAGIRNLRMRNSLRKTFKGRGNNMPRP